MKNLNLIIRKAAKRWAERRKAECKAENHTETTHTAETPAGTKQAASKESEETQSTTAAQLREQPAAVSSSSSSSAAASAAVASAAVATFPIVSTDKENEVTNRINQTEEQLTDFLTTHYRFRYNVLSDVTEYAPVSSSTGFKDKSKKMKEAGMFRPVTVRALNSFCLAAHREGIPCWDRDMARLVNSTRIPDYHPFTDYLDRLPQWDGRDRIDALAARVSDSDFWKRHFHRWLLGVVAQWTGRDPLHANSVAPLLVSKVQGMGKSAFCRALLPPELRAYYSDCVDLNAPESIERKLTELGLLCLDEFDRISPKRQPQLKNIMQLSALNFRKAYSRHAGERRRIASFIGTSNSRELLSDPSGSRRFICVEVEHPIDCTDIDHDMIYAQLKAELERGERYWFNAEEEAELQENNRDFYRTNTTEDLVRQLFRIPKSDEKPGLMALDELMDIARKRNRHALRGINAQAFSRALVTAGFTRRHTREGNRYEVAIRDQ